MGGDDLVVWRPVSAVLRRRRSCRDRAGLLGWGGDQRPRHGRKHFEGGLGSPNFLPAAKDAVDGRPAEEKIRAASSHCGWLAGWPLFSGSFELRFETVIVILVQKKKEKKKKKE